MSRVDANGLPDFGMGGAEQGLSQDRRAELTAAIDRFRIECSAVQTAIGEAEQARQELLSWARLAERLANVVIPLIQSAVAGGAGGGAQTTAPAQAWRGTLSAGLAGLIQAPADQRPQTLQALIVELLGKQ